MSRCYVVDNVGCILIDANGCAVYITICEDIAEDSIVTISFARRAEVSVNIDAEAGGFDIDISKVGEVVEGVEVNAYIETAINVDSEVCA